MQLSHLSIIFENICFNDYTKFWFFAYKQLTWLCIICPAFMVLKIIRKCSFGAALNFEFYLSDWNFRLTLFTAVLISNTASDGDLTPPILPGGKILGRPHLLRSVYIFNMIESKFNCFCWKYSHLIWESNREYVIINHCRAGNFWTNRVNVFRMLCFS